MAGGKFSAAQKSEYKLALARNNLGCFILATLPQYQMGWVHERICAELERFLADVVAKKSPRLMLTMPPRHGKSTIVSRYFPAYALGRFPDMNIIATSYGADLASRMNRDVQRIMENNEYIQLFPATRLGGRGSHSAGLGSYLRNSDMFEIVGHSGSYRSAGVGGGITGMGAECVDGESLVMVPGGCAKAKDITPGMVVMSFNFQAGEMQPCVVEAVRRKRAVEIYRLHSDRGRSLDVTGNHPIFSQGEFIEAHSLATGAPLLCGMWDRIRHDGVRVPQTCNEGLSEMVLHESMPQQSRKEKMEGAPGTGASLRSLWRSSRRHWRLYKNTKEILPKLYRYCTAGILGRETQTTCSFSLSRLWARFYGEAGWKVYAKVLFQRMRGFFAWCFHDGKRQYQMEGQRHNSQTCGATNLFPYQKIHQREGQILCRLWNKREPTISSCGSRPGEQYSTEYCSGMRTVPQGNSSTGVLWRVRDEILTSNQKIPCPTGRLVVDLQVSGCHNFFANGVLVHNCAIIDDPFKSRAEADSATVRQNVWEWFTSTLYTRLSPGGGIIIINTRWHMNDLSGRLLEADRMGEGDHWRVVNFPAIAETDEEYRKAGEALHPERYPLEQLLAIKKAIGTRDWEALYQQHPTPDGGNIFKKEWMRFYKPTDLPDRFDQVLASWDMTFKDGDDTDYVVGQVWGRKGADRFLLDQVRARMGFTDTLTAFRALAAKWPQASRKLVEDKANGPAVIDSLKHAVPGIIPVNPDGSKTARAYAVTTVFESGNVYLPHPASCPWVGDYVAELTQFPGAAHDDQVDATTQALRDMERRPGLNINQSALRPTMRIR